MKNFFQILFWSHATLLSSCKESANFSPVGIYSNSIDGVVISLELKNNGTYTLDVHNGENHQSLQSTYKIVNNAIELHDWLEGIDRINMRRLPKIKEMSLTDVVLHEKSISVDTDGRYLLYRR